LRLLLDENLSHRLIERLADIYPGSQHVRQLGLKSAPDRIVLGYAELMEMVLVTKDTDFDDLGILRSDAVRILRLDLGNCTTDDVERALRKVEPDLPSLFEDGRIVSIIRRAGG